MSEFISKRYLLDLDLDLNIFNDLLYFDSLMYVGIGTSITCENLEKLYDKNLIIECDRFLMYNKPTATPSLSKLLKNGVHDHRMFEELKRSLANLISKRDINVTPRYNLDNFNKEYGLGKIQILSIIYSHLPTLDLPFLNIDYLVGFLSDEETKIKRRRLFSWQNEIENKIEKGEIKIEHVPDMIATYLDDYTKWIEKSELKLKYEKQEVVYYFLSSLLSPIKLPEAIKKLFEFKKRKLDLLDEEKVSGRELAYIVHAQRRFTKP